MYSSWVRAIYPFCIFLFLMGVSEFARGDSNINKIISPSIKGDTLYIDGAIDSHIYDFLSYSHQKLQTIKQISLNSYGGSHYWALEIGRKIRKLNITTVLESGNVCASACVYLYGAGARQVADEGTWFGIHGARPAKHHGLKLISSCYFENNEGLYEFDIGLNGCQEVYNDTYRISLESTKEAFLELEKTGSSPKLFEAYMNLEEDPNWQAHLNVLKIRDWRLPAKEALEFGLVHALR